MMGVMLRLTFFEFTSTPASSSKDAACKALLSGKQGEIVQQVAYYYVVSFIILLTGMHRCEVLCLLHHSEYELIK